MVAIVAAAFASAAGVGVAATFALTSAHLGAASLTTPVMFPDSVTIANKPGQTLGRADNGDTVTFVFSRQIDEPSLCSNWPNSDPTPPQVKLTWSIINGVAPAHDTLAVTAFPAATCTGGFHIGNVDLGSAGYNTSTNDMDFPSNTVLTVGATTSTIVVTLAGRKGGTQGIVSGDGPATWTPDSALTDRSGNNCGANLAMTSSATQF